MRAPRLAVWIAVAAVAVVVAAVPGSAGARPTSSTRSVRLASSTLRAAAPTYSLPADCRPSPVAPPYELGTLIQIGHPAGLDPSIPDGTLTAGPVAVTGISASLCGVVTVEPGKDGCVAEQTITIPADGQHFAGLEAVLSVNPAEPSTVPFRVIPRTITASLGCGSSVNGLAVDSTAALEGSTGLFGIGCVIGPSTATLTGNVTSPTQSFSDFEGTLAGPIGLPTATVSHTCPSEIAANLNLLAGLPRTGQLTLPTKVSLYQAGSAP